MDSHIVQWLSDNLWWLLGNWAFISCQPISMIPAFAWQSMKQSLSNHIPTPERIESFFKWHKDIYFCDKRNLEDDAGSGGFSLSLTADHPPTTPPILGGVSRPTGIPIKRKQAAVTVSGVVCLYIFHNNNS